MTVSDDNKCLIYRTNEVSNSNIRLLCTIWAETFTPALAHFVPFTARYGPTRHIIVRYGRATFNWVLPLATIWLAWWYECFINDSFDNYREHKRLIIYISFCWNKRMQIEIYLHTFILFVAKTKTTGFGDGKVRAFPGYKFKDLSGSAFVYVLVYKH